MEKITIEPKKDNEIKVIHYELDGVKYDIEVKTYLSLTDKLTVVNSVVDTIFNGTYMPEYKDIIMFRSILSALTNITMPSSKMEDENGTEVEMLDIESCYELMIKSNLINFLCEADDKVRSIIWDIEDLIEEKIQYRKALIFNYRDFTEVTDSIDDKFKNVNELVDNINLFVTNLNALANTLDMKLNDLDLSDFNGILENINQINKL